MVTQSTKQREPPGFDLLLIWLLILILIWLLILMVCPVKRPGRLEASLNGLPEGPRPQAEETVTRRLL